MSYIPDALDLFDHHDMKQQKELDRLPKCRECDHPIQSDICYEINDELICEQCLTDNHRKITDDYIS